MKLYERLTPLFIMVALLVGWAACLGAQTKPTGELHWAWHITLAPAWFDPAKAPAQIAPFLILYALHDGLLRPLPGERMGNSLAEAWTESPDGLVYEFKLRQGLRFHNGDPFTAEDVKFSFERYSGTGAKELQTKVKATDSPCGRPLTAAMWCKLWGSGWAVKRVTANSRRSVWADGA